MCARQGISFLENYFSFRIDISDLEHFFGRHTILELSSTATGVYIPTRNLRLIALR